MIVDEIPGGEIAWDMSHELSRFEGGELSACRRSTACD